MHKLYSFRIYFFSRIQKINKPFFIFYDFSCFCRCIFIISHKAKGKSLYTKSFSIFFQKRKSLQNTSSSNFKIRKSRKCNLSLSHHQRIKIIPNKVLYIWENFYDKFYSFIKMILVVFIDNIVYLYSYS